MDSVEDYARKWAKDEDSDLNILSEWIKSIRKLVKSRIGHLRQEMSTRMTYHQCHQCGSEFESYYDLELHMFLHEQLDVFNGQSDVGQVCDEYLEDVLREITSPSFAEMSSELDINTQSPSVAPVRVQSPVAGPSHVQSPPPAHVQRPERSHFQCDKCHKTYTRKNSLIRHVKSAHEGVRHHCSHCERKFKFSSDRNIHEKKCKGSPTNRRKRRDVMSSMKKAPFTLYHCRDCSESFEDRRQLYLHKMQYHFQQGGGSISLQSPPWVSGTPAWEGDDKLRQVYEANAPLILENHRMGPVTSTYNFPIGNDFTIPDVMRAAEEVYDRQQSAFRMNMEFGLILVNTETGDYRYFKPYSNEELFSRPIYVSRRRNLQRLRMRLERFDITDFILRQRPNTKWKPFLVTNFRFTLYHLNFTLGCPKLQLPHHVTGSKSIVALDKNRKGRLYGDNLCAFRCLAVHRGHHTRGLETETRSLYRRWIDFCKECNIFVNVKHFPGIDLQDLVYFEKCFQVQINAFQLRDDFTAISVYKSRHKYEDTMNVNVYDRHLSYIKKLESYTQKYQCRTCEMHFKRLKNMKQHQKTCKGRTKYEFLGGFYTAPKTIFDKLEAEGIHVPVEKRFYPWFCVWDMESILKPATEVNTDKFQWTQQHVPISVSVCSNVEDYREPHCILEPDLNILVGNMVQYMDCIKSKSHLLALDRFSVAFQQLDQAIEELELGKMDTCGNEILENWAMSGEWEKMAEEQKERLEKLKEELDQYCQQLICLGFNSQKYDMNLIKKYLAKHLNMHTAQKTFTVKRNNAYACLSNDNFKFLDVTQYLAPGLNYARFLKAFDVEESKAFFPYEWFDSLQKLKCTELPPIGPAWHSSLRDDSVLNDGLLTPEENHARVLQVWHQGGMQTFRDYLIYYNNLDVGPFVEAVEKLQNYYFDRNIDIFKVSISVPGLARQMLFECGRKAGASFALVDEANKDLYHTIKQNIVGGPSIIFHRHHEKGKTFLRGNPKKPCQTICGFDANALYLYCFNKDMPSGPFVRRRVINDFKPEKRDKYMLAYDWLDYINATQQLNIVHKLNTGKEKLVGPYPVDGYDAITNTIYQFHGCYWHGHVCWMTRDVKDGKWQQSRAKKLEKTQKTTAYLKARGYTVVEMWECTFRNDCRWNADLKAFVENRRPPTKQGSVKAEEILEAVVQGKLFGMVECDICVPEVWPTHFRHPTMSPYEYFQEMSPLFCTTDVPFEIIGDHMQAHAKRFELSTKPRRLLVGGMKARQILIATPLLKWYIEHGLEISKVYQSVEYTPKPCFRNFVKDVSDARRMGDVDPSKSIIADTRKLEGNSAYGSTIMDQEKFQQVIYVQGEGKAMTEANLPQFKKLTTLLEEEEYYEVEKAKTKLKLNLPVQIDNFILQYAKLHMLQFYYDFLDQFVDRADFEYCEMDTDSAYMALSGPNLESVIKPDMLAKYRDGLEGYCSDIEIEADGLHHWFPRSCCSRHARHDKRTPGLFKMEFQGDNMISLCSKTYIVSKSKTVKTSSSVIAAHALLKRAKNQKVKRLNVTSRITHDIKFSSKGISKRFVKAPLSIFKNVLNTQRAGSGINRGFKARNNGIYSYKQQRNGFSYFYCKRKVEVDGVTTSPLDLELCPIREDDLDEAQV